MSTPESALRTITLRTCRVIQQLFLQNEPCHTHDAIILQCELLYRYTYRRPLSNAGVSGRKKAKVCFSDCNMQKDLSKWNKQELQAYLIHYNLKKSGNKPDLLLRIRQRMDTD